MPGTEHRGELLPIGEPYDTTTGKTIYEKVLEREIKSLKKENLKLINGKELKKEVFSPLIRRIMPLALRVNETAVK